MFKLSHACFFAVQCRLPRVRRNPGTEKRWVPSPPPIHWPLPQPICHTATVPDPSTDSQTAAGIRNRELSFRKKEMRRFVVKQKLNINPLFLESREEERRKSKKYHFKARRQRIIIEILVIRLFSV